ncbi:hypothetical protein QQF64_032731 [Cirrhinus molitorella]|uniref:Uncharacterized protein n=1 Tax=Cirrhinus molitorella TaxID=172907 RepID=A0ABR3MRW5_9TELE
MRSWATMEIVDALCGRTKVASFADPFQLLFAGAFYGGLFQEGRSSRFLCGKCQKCRRNALLGTFPNAHCFNGCQRESNETSLTKAVTAPCDSGREAHSMWGFVSLSGPFQCLVCTSPRDAFASSRSRRGIPLSAATLRLRNIVFLLARIQQSLSVLKDFACILSGRTARSNKAPRAMQRAPPLCWHDL